MTERDEKSDDRSKRRRRVGVLENAVRIRRYATATYFRAAIRYETDRSRGARYIGRVSGTVAASRRT